MSLARPIAEQCLQEPATSLSAWTLGLLDMGDLTQFAVLALSRGIDSTALRALAGLLPNDGVAADQLLARVVDELGWTVPDRRSAALQYALCVSRLIVSGKLPPYDGANALWEASLAVRDTSFHDLDPFIYASSEYKSRPGDRALFDKMILEEARRRLLNA